LAFACISLALRLVVEILSSESGESIGLHLPQSGKFLDLFRHLGGKVVLFGPVGLEIIQFPRSAFRSD
jgi:hypothetical protein